jgi:hypothetical protein
MGEYLEHHFYSEVLGPIRANVDSALSKGLSAAGLLVSRADLTHLSKMREDGEVAEADAYQALLIDRTFEAAERLSSAFAHWLRAFEHVLPILSGMRPADLVRGGVTRAHPGKAGATKKYARGIQAATAKVYRAGMSEQDCWEALGGVEDETFPVEGAVYEFRLDRRETEIVTAWQTDDRTGRERSIKRTSFHPYFVRARDTPSTA